MFYSDIPEGKVVWAYAYQTGTIGETLTLKKEPVEGVVIENDTTKPRSYRDDYFFYELNKDGTPKKSSKVRARNRSYALTKEEAIIGYNNKINEHIIRLQKEINYHQNHIIK